MIPSRLSTSVTPALKQEKRLLVKISQAGGQKLCPDNWEEVSLWKQVSLSEVYANLSWQDSRRDSKIVQYSYLTLYEIVWSGPNLKADQ